MNHTPGPWHIGEGKGEQIIYTEAGWAVASATVFHGKHGAQEMKANARLIAAVPDMLAALALLVDGDGKPDECRRAMDAARAALAKARGE